MGEQQILSRHHRLHQHVGLALWLFNLYLDPEEVMTVGHRRNAWLASVTAKLKARGATFKKYPPRTLVSGCELDEHADILAAAT